MELALHLLMRAVIPRLGLKECLHNWREISQTLAEGPRRRRLQIEALMLSSRAWGATPTEHGFTLARMNGSHHVFSRDDVPELINIQNVGGQAKPYQIRQFLRLIEKYDLKLEEK
jgi:predicted RNA binding protein YcfA (HicA-like mRNA interferase family)